jgi:hypothetical protein
MQAHKGMAPAGNEYPSMPERPRLFSLAIALALTLGLVPAAAADEAMSGREMIAEASWMFPKAQPNTYTGFMVLAWDQEPSEGPDVSSMALAFSGPCRQEEDMTTCEGRRGGVFDLKPGQLQVASDWSSATLNVGRKKDRVSLTWIADLLLFPSSTGTAGGSSGGPKGGYEYETEGFGISRPATPEGTMFGRTLGTDGLESASFYEGQYQGTYRTQDRFITIGSVRWRLPV